MVKSKRYIVNYIRKIVRCILVDHLMSWVLLNGRIRFSSSNFKLLVLVEFWVVVIELTLFVLVWLLKKKEKTKKKNHRLNWEGKGIFKGATAKPPSLSPAQSKTICTTKTFYSSFYMFCPSIYCEGRHIPFVDLYFCIVFFFFLVILRCDGMVFFKSKASTLYIPKILSHRRWIFVESLLLCLLE